MKTATLPLLARRGSSKASTDTISVGANLDMSSARRFARAVGRMINRRPSHVIIDLSKLQNFDSSGFGSLISALKKISDAGATPVVVCKHPSVRRLMDFAGVSHTFTIVGTMADARRALADSTADALAS
ncbi:MAG TPA: STAS domain-containing protein [Candidatus Acidoferrales bacterium]|nr:STAS domain-containing protein [Candidatus Acidoferrales bacterium]